MNFKLAFQAVSEAAFFQALATETDRNWCLVSRPGGAIALRQVELEHGWDLACPISAVLHTSMVDAYEYAVKFGFSREFAGSIIRAADSGYAAEFLDLFPAEAELTALLYAVCEATCYWAEP